MEKNMDFEPGRIVTLKSGGPPLTVVGMDGEQVRCIWFAHADDRLQEASIPAVCLEIVSDEDGDYEDEDNARPSAPGGRHR
jgi:uncharacterized protein YodC (DUF2158 family)